MARPAASASVTSLPHERKGLRPNASIGPLALDQPHLRTLVAHVAAVAMAIVVMALQGTQPMGASDALIGLVIALGFTALRVLSVSKRLALSTLALDAVGTVLFLAGTGGPSSPFNFIALAGVWWAAHVPRRHSGLAYGLVLVNAYLLLVMPQAMRDRLLVEAVEEMTALIVVAFLSDWFVRVDRRALLLNEALQAAPFGVDQLAIREALARTLRTMDIPLDVVLAAGQLGLTAIQAELLAYLVLGLTNQEISDATRVSEPTVRYRLTRLYRTLGVRGRSEARRRASELGIRGPGAEQVSARPS